VWRGGHDVDGVSPAPWSALSGLPYFFFDSGGGGGRGRTWQAEEAQSRPNRLLGRQEKPSPPLVAARGLFPKNVKPSPTAAPPYEGKEEAPTDRDEFERFSLLSRDRQPFMRRAKPPTPGSLPNLRVPRVPLGRSGVPSRTGNRPPSREIQAKKTKPFV